MGKNKPETHRRYMRTYTRKIRRAYRKIWKEVISDEMGELSCEACGFDQFPALDFHHIDPKEKEIKLSSYWSKKPTPERIDLVRTELQKCMILCANCHRLRHYAITPH